MSEKCQKVFDEILRLVPTVQFSEIKRKRAGRLRFPVYVNEALRTTDIEALDLSVRASNSLHRAGYKTIGDLVESIQSLDDLRRIRNCGTKSVNEIMEKLFCYHYSQLPNERKVAYIHKVIECNINENL